MKASVIIGSLALWLSLLSFGCKTVEVEVSQKQQALDWLNERRYDDAIFLLEDLVRKDPGDHHLKVLLSSAIAGKVGFDLVDSFPAYKAIIDSSKTDAGFYLEDNGLPDHIENSEDFERWLVALLRNSANVFRAAYKFRHLEGEQRRYLLDAIQYLREVPPESEQYISAMAYLAMINLYQVTNYFKDAFPSDALTGEWSFEALACKIEVGKFFKSLAHVADYLLGAIKALEALESKTGEKPEWQKLKDLKDKAQEMRRFYNDNKNVINSSDLLVQFGQFAYCDDL